jgi:hypothetical protein
MLSPSKESAGSFYFSSFMDAIVANSIPPILAGMSSAGYIVLIYLINIPPELIKPLTVMKPTCMSEFKNGIIAFGYEDGSSAVIILFPTRVIKLVTPCLLMPVYMVSINFMLSNNLGVSYSNGVVCV